MSLSPISFLSLSPDSSKIRVACGKISQFFLHAHPAFRLALQSMAIHSQDCYIGVPRDPN